MLVEFIRKCECLGYPSVEDANDDTNECTKLFNVGDQIELEIVGHPKRWDDITNTFVYDPDHVDVQFEDGSLALCINRDWFRVVE